MWRLNYMASKLFLPTAGFKTTDPSLSFRVRAHVRCFDSDSADAEPGSPPWQKRIQGLKIGGGKSAHQESQRMGSSDMPFGVSQITAPGDVDPSANPRAINPCNPRPADGS
jgi:hypothetical protein